MRISKEALYFIKEEGKNYNSPAIYLMEYDKKTCCGVSQRIEPTIMEDRIGLNRKSLVQKNIDGLPYPIFIEQTHEIIWNLGKIDVMGLRAAKKLVFLYPE